jgi:hypothetical protein
MKQAIVDASSISSIASLFASLTRFYKLKVANHSKSKTRNKNEKTIVNIERISGCIPKLNIAKTAFLDYESSALPLSYAGDHYPRWPAARHLVQLPQAINVQT